jgi:hypothetical protein
MIADIENKIEQVKRYLRDNFNWTDTNINFVHKEWIVKDLKTNSTKDAARIHDERCAKLAKSVGNEFQASHSDMSPSGAKAYASNWN